MGALHGTVMQTLTIEILRNLKFYSTFQQPFSASNLDMRIIGLATVSLLLPLLLKAEDTTLFCKGKYWDNGDGLLRLDGVASLVIDVENQTVRYETFETKFNEVGNSISWRHYYSVNRLYEDHLLNRGTGEYEKSAWSKAAEDSEFTWSDKQTFLCKKKEPLF